MVDPEFNKQNKKFSLPPTLIKTKNRRGDYKRGYGVGNIGTAANDFLAKVVSFDGSAVTGDSIVFRGNIDSRGTGLVYGSGNQGRIDLRKKRGRENEGKL